MNMRGKVYLTSKVCCYLLCKCSLLFSYIRILICTIYQYMYVLFTALSSDSKWLAVIRIVEFVNVSLTERSWLNCTHVVVIQTCFFFMLGCSCPPTKKGSYGRKSYKNLSFQQFQQFSICECDEKNYWTMHADRYVWENNIFPFWIFGEKSKIIPNRRN